MSGRRIHHQMHEDKDGPSDVNMLQLLEAESPARMVSGHLAFFIISIIRIIPITRPISSTFACPTESARNRQPFGCWLNTSKGNSEEGREQEAKKKYSARWGVKLREREREVEEGGGEKEGS